MSTVLVDGDVHPALNAPISAVLEYLPRAWREKFDYLGEIPLAASPLEFNYLLGSYVVGKDTLGRMTFPDRPDVEAFTGEVFGQGGADVGQMIVPEVVTHSYPARNAEIGVHLAGAFNDYVLDQWVVDERLRYALVVFPGDPAAAAAEIRRHGDDRRVSSVWLPTSDVRFGAPGFNPVYEAALEFGLPIISHPAASAVMASPEMAFEGRASAPAGVWANIASLVAAGVFERYRELRFVFFESGFTWLDAMVRRMDAGWRAGGDRLPALERAPNEIVREHVRISTQPIDDDRDASELCRLIEESDLLGDVLVYGSNFPRQGAASAASAFAGLSDETRRKIMAENAKAVLRL